VAQLANGGGNATKTYQYDAFGNEKNPDENDLNPFRYCAEYFDRKQEVFISGQGITNRK